MEIIKIENKNRKEDSLAFKRIVSLIKKGAIAIFPTDTVYGVLADATNKKAVERIFKIKKRRKNQYLPIFVKDKKSAKKIAKIGEKEKFLLKIFWPGQVTAILKRKKGLKLYGVNKETIALRVPDFPLLNKLLKKVGRPLTATSANTSGKSPSSNKKGVIKYFSGSKNKPDILVDVGILPKRKPSIIIDLSGEKAKFLRV